MVLCKFFQQGTCRFGSKCVNEHFDIKHQIKTDVEAAIDGKQWPLSTYGPFRDKPSIPNFIEDQSFEEVRMLCYEAKQKNFFDQFHQQFNKEALEASNKMKALLQMTPDIVDVIISVYHTPSDTSCSGVGKVQNVNSRGLANAADVSSNSIFGKSPNNPTNSIFANNNGTTNQGASGIFANTSQYTSQNEQQQTSIFGQPSKSVNSIFDVGSNTQQNTPKFAQQQGQSAFFSSSAQKQQPTSAATGLFSQQNQFVHQPHQNSNIFRQAVQASQPQQGLFAQAAHTIQQQQNQQQPGLFAQSSPQTVVGQGLFSQAAQQTQNLFCQTLQQQQQTNSNIFQQCLPNSGSPQQQMNTNAFQQDQSIAMQQQIQQQQSALFQQAANHTQNSGSQMTQLTHASSTLYSRLEDLTADEVDAFKADCFQPGKIPFNPPPRELIN